jgi:hypothetical protein
MTRTVLMIVARRPSPGLPASVIIFSMSFDSIPGTTPVIAWLTSWGASLYITPATLVTMTSSGAIESIV